MLTQIEPTFSRPDIIARCEKTEAYFSKSRKQYALVVPGQPTRHWQRNRFMNDAEAIAAANTLLK